MLNVKIKYLDDCATDRQKNADDYAYRLTKAGIVGNELSLTVIKHGRHIFNQYILRVKDRDGLLAHLKNAGVGAEIYYPLPMHLQECFRYLEYRQGDMPESESVAKSTVAIPIYPELPDAQRAYVVEAIFSFYKIDQMGRQLWNKDLLNSKSLAQTELYREKSYIFDSEISKQQQHFQAGRTRAGRSTKQT